MRVTSVLGESLRNTLTGASHAILLTLLTLTVIGGLAAAETLTVNTLTQRAQDYRAAGGDVTVISAPPTPEGDHFLSGAACDALAALPGIDAAGALREGGQRFTLAALPSAYYNVFDASPGLRAVLDVDGTPATPGLWLTDSVAAATAADTGDELVLDDGSNVTVSGVFDYPSDGRPVQLANAAIAPGPVDDSYDQCWIRSWPPITGLAALANSLLTPDADPDTRVTTSRLNTTLAAEFDGATQFAERLTALAGPAAALAGLALGFAVTRTRRRAIAYHRHLGIPVSAQTLQVLIETALPVGTAALIATAATGLAATTPEAWHLALRIIVIGSATALAGASVALATIRETHLFRYVKE